MEMSMDLINIVRYDLDTICKLVNMMKDEDIEDYLLYDVSRCLIDNNFDWKDSEDEDELIYLCSMILESFAIHLVYYEYDDLGWSGTDYQYNIDNISKGLKNIILDLQEVYNERE